MEEEGEVGSDQKQSSPEPVAVKKAQQQSLAEEQRRLNRLVQDQRRSVGRIRIPSQLERWTRVKEELGLVSHEDVAKLLLDSL